MARVEMMSGIASVSGRLGNYCFRTMKSTGKVYMHTIPSKKSKSLVAAKAPSAAVLAQRQRFSAIAKMVTQMRKSGTRKNTKQLWKIATQAYDAAH